MLDDLPGAFILNDGLRDLEQGELSEAALLVLIGAPRFLQLGVHLPPSNPLAALPEHMLFDLLVEKHGVDAYRHYNSLLRLLVSLENAMEVSGMEQENFKV